MVTREGDKYVAVQHRTSNPVTVKIDRNGNLYSFVPKHNVSLAWIRPEDLDSILAIQEKVCCGNNKALKFHLASQINTCLWETGERC
jgi:hypothetical protein